MPLNVSECIDIVTALRKSKENGQIQNQSNPNLSSTTTILTDPAIEKLRRVERYLEYVHLSLDYGNKDGLKRLLNFTDDSDDTIPLRNRVCKRAINLACLELQTLDSKNFNNEFSDNTSESSKKANPLTLDNLQREVQGFATLINVNFFNEESQSSSEDSQKNRTVPQHKVKASIPPLNTLLNTLETSIKPFIPNSNINRDSASDQDEIPEETLTLVSYIWELAEVYSEMDDLSMETNLEVDLIALNLSLEKFCKIAEKIHKKHEEEALNNSVLRLNGNSNEVQKTDKATLKTECTIKNTAEKFILETWEILKEKYWDLQSDNRSQNTKKTDTVTEIPLLSHKAQDNSSKNKPSVNNSIFLTPIEETKDIISAYLNSVSDSSKPHILYSLSKHNVSILDDIANMENMLERINNKWEWQATSAVLFLVLLSPLAFCDPTVTSAVGYLLSALNPHVFAIVLAASIVIYLACWAAEAYCLHQLHTTQSMFKSEKLQHEQYLGGEQNAVEDSFSQDTFHKEV